MLSIVTHSKYVFVVPLVEQQPSVAVRPNPIKFKLPPIKPGECKENQSPRTGRLMSQHNHGLDYRTVFAVLTWDSIVLYDTYHHDPLCFIRGLHYSHLVDATWSANGRHLTVCSTDGYISIVSFAEGELGEVYSPPVESQYASAEPSPAHVTLEASKTSAVGGCHVQDEDQVGATLVLPPCEPGQAAVLEEPPSKRAKTRITPTLVSATTTTTSSATKRSIDDALQVHEAVKSLTLHSNTAATAEGTDTSQSLDPMTTDDRNNDNPKKKQKKRIQPTLLVSE